jgi:hypothetical protein
MSESPSLEQLLVNYAVGGAPHGIAGSEQFRVDLKTDALSTTDEDVKRNELSLDEVNDVLAYLGWNQWDLMAFRSTEGESGLIPRQEYESLAWTHMWEVYPQLRADLTRAVGADGLVEIGRIGRREMGSKIDALHVTSGLYCYIDGRATTMALGMTKPDDRIKDVNEAIVFNRRLMHGLWGGGPAFASMRNYTVPTVDNELLQRFHDESKPMEDEGERSRYARLIASLELLSFMTHVDCRAGIGDTGPFPAGDGAVMIVRNIMLHEETYHWSRAAWNLPYAITIAMTLRPPAGMQIFLNDIGTTFTDPRDYLPYLSRVAVYQRHKWNTPVGQIDPVSAEDCVEITKKASRATLETYKIFASMSRREKIMAGAKVYFGDFIMPFARAAGVWDRWVAEEDVFEIPKSTSDAYYMLDADFAANVVPRVFLLAEGFRPIAAA